MTQQDASPTADHDPVAARAGILDRIAAAAKASGLDGAPPTLVAVSKQQPWSRVKPVLEAGQRVFGENRVQEATERWQDQRDAWPGLELRLIGPLQSNKARAAMELFDVLESVDREGLARTLADFQQKGVSTPRLFIQVNTGEEPQKAGVSPKDADAFIARVRNDFQLPLEGLMCIPPADEPAGPHFALLARIAARNGLEKLSMGMSGDFETAVRFGATSVRVGAALFGAR